MSNTLPKPGRGGARRYRIVYDAKADTWHCAKLDGHGREVGRSPGGNELDAERYENNMRRYGAWQRS